MILAKCNWCGKTFENYVFSLAYWTNKCKQEEKQTLNHFHFKNYLNLLKYNT